MKLSTKFVHVMNAYDELDKVCNDLEKEKLQPNKYHRACSESIDKALISLVELKEAYYKKLTGVL